MNMDTISTNLTLIDLAALSPLLILLGGALLLLLLESFSSYLANRWSTPLAFVAIALALVAAVYAPASEHPLLTPWLKFDMLARFFSVLFLSIGLAVTLLSASFFQRFQASHGEFFFLLLAALFGLLLIGSSADFLTLFLGLETLSIALYVLCGYIKHWKFSSEAAIKYFLLGSLAAAFLLYGIALIYGAVGNTSFSSLLAAYEGLEKGPSMALFTGGIAFVFVGLGFKAAIVPFHSWAPDVYDAAPTPVTAFMAAATKAGAFAALVNVFMIALPNFSVQWNHLIAILVVPTLIYANFVALREKQLRRFFAYSGISHAGYLLILFATPGPDALSALIFYLVIYVLATLGSFAVLSFLDETSDGAMLRDLQGLFQRSPSLAIALALCLLTLAGIPPTAGFLAKFFLFKVAFQAGYYPLVIIGLLAAILSAYYYLRIISIMLSEPEEKAPILSRSSWPAAAVAFASLAAIAILSCYPAPLLNW